MDAWYLKYRSQDVGELDSDFVRTALLKVIDSGKIPQALLFTGPRGTGKTSAARILAKVLNCEKNKEGKTLSEPCNKCAQCQAITGGSAIDVLEIDAASNRGIDDIRELRERVKLAPSSGRYRVYIVDEVHMLTNEAFNALLKTLEEPPRHAVFILCTTDPQKIPETILSRCTRIIFPQASVEEIANKLKKVVKTEGLTIDEAGLLMVAEAAKGSFRDGIKLLEQVVSGKSGEKVKTSEIVELLGRAKGVEPERMLKHLVLRDVKAAMEEVGVVVGSGASIRTYIEDLVELLRSSLLGKVGVSGPGVAVSGDVTSLSALEMDRLIRLLSRAYSELKDAVLPQLPLELSVIEWCLEGGQESKSKESEDTEEKERRVVKNEEVIQSSSEELGEVSSSGVSEHWAEIMQKVKPKNHSVEALLRACRPLSIAKGFLNIEVYYKFHKERLETDRCRSIVEETIAEVMGVPLKIKFQLGERAVKREADAATLSQNDVSGKEVDEEIVKAAAEIFKGTVVE